MFRDAHDHGNAAADLYRVTRPPAPMREALELMVSDSTGPLAWGFDPADQSLPIDDVDRAEASKLLAAGYAVRRVLGVHPLDDVAKPEDAVFDASDLEARRYLRRRRQTVA